MRGVLLFGADGGHMAEAEREEWVERFLALLCSEAEGDALRHAASTALAGHHPPFQERMRYPGWSWLCVQELSLARQR